jgi:hypothetical protein
MRSHAVHASVLGIILLSGCTLPRSDAGAGTGAGGGYGDGQGTSSPTGGTPALSGITDAGTAPPPVAPDQCSDESKLVYVVSRENDLYSFRPDTVTFTKVGALQCPAASSDFPFSMAVDRSGTAWILYTDGVLYKASTKDASCTKTSYAPNQAGFGLFGMGFAALGPGSSTDVLYVSENRNGNGLGMIDLGTLTLRPIGGYGVPLSGQRAELTGTGDGSLYGFFWQTPPSVAQIGKTDATVSTPAALANVQMGTDWAFSFWGGDFYLYTGNSTNPAQTGSAVTRYRPSDGSVTVVSQSTGFFITGAGVSTCAPVVPPPPPPPPPPPK